MTKTAIRPPILRHYYEEAFDARDPLGRYEGANAEEFVALRQIEVPTLTPRAALDRAAAFGRPELKPYAEKYPPAPVEIPQAEVDVAMEGHPHLSLERGRVDLQEKLRGAPARVLDLQSVEVRGWAGLAAPQPWVHVELRVCKSTDPVALVPPAPVQRMVLTACDPTCVGAALRSTSARDLDVDQVDRTEPLDLRPLAAHAQLEQLFAAAPLVHGTRHLRRLPLRKLILFGVAWTDELAETIAALGRSLEELAVVSEDAFPPSALPLPRGLRALTVGPPPELREAWVDFAVSRYPKVRVVFTRADTPRRRLALAETHLDVDVLRRRDAKQDYLVSGDAPGADAARLRDGLRDEAKRERRKLRWSDRPGGFTLETSDVETARWAVDRLRAAGWTPAAAPGEAGRAKASPPGKRRTAPSSKAPTLASLRKKRRFAGWDGDVSPALIKAARAIFQEAIDALVTLGPGATAARQRPVLRKCIEDFNRLEEEHDFITTIEAEDIVSEFQELVAATRLAGEADLADEWRDF